MSKLIKKWRKKRLEDAVTAMNIDKETNKRQVVREARGQACLFNIPDYKKKRR